MAAVLPDPFYYLENFRYVLAWVGSRHHDLLDARERQLISTFSELPRAAQALLVRMVMRKGDLFRYSKLSYAEIGDIASPVVLLAEHGLIDVQPELELEELFSLLRKDELLSLFGDALKEANTLKSARKEELLAALMERYPDAQPLAQWQPTFDDSIYRLLHPDIYDRLRLMFFGNLHQDWSEFVLTDLGLLKYEAVEISATSRAFQARADVDAYLHLYDCRERLEAGEDPRDVLADIPAPTCSPDAAQRNPGSGPPPGHNPEGFFPGDDNPAGGIFDGDNPGFRCAAPGLRVPKAVYSNAWLEERRSRLLFAIGQELEREKELDAALAVYQASSWPEARLRAIRVLEQLGQHEAAFQLADALWSAGKVGMQSMPTPERTRQVFISGKPQNESRPASTPYEAPPREEDLQQLARILPRLRRKLGLEKVPATPLIVPERMDFELAAREELSVEWLVQAHLHTDHAPVFYVENALINSLFGLLCWRAIFAPLPGAFFHAFHYGPVDLHHPDFYARRAPEFAACLGLLDSGGYREAILSTFHEKCGTASPFVFWDVLDEELLTLALDCIPPTHLRALFARLLADIKSNRSGFPDLIQFWPAEKRYLMLEVKGPGDRLQDNQIRWLDYCARHGIPVAVSHVTWVDEA